MIHFDFVVTEDEAYDIFQAISNEIASLISRKMEEIDENDGQYVEYFDNRIDYLKQLKDKMSNTLVK